MHITGKVFLWLALIGCVASLYLSAKALDIRRAWMLKIQKSEDEFVKNQELIDKKVKTLQDTRTELARVMLDWDRYWGEINASMLEGGKLALDVGTNRGLTEKQVVFAFAPNGDGTFTF